MTAGAEALSGSSAPARPAPAPKRAPRSRLVVESISVRRAQRTIVERVSFTVEPAEIIVVIGANGAGKTSLLEAVVGATRVRSGNVLFDDRELVGLAGHASVFSYMPDAAEPPAEVRVSTLMRLAQLCGNVGDAQARALAENLRLAPLASARAGELSRGEKRRVSLFTALCTDRPVVVLDEPLGGARQADISHGRRAQYRCSATCSTRC